MKYYYIYTGPIYRFDVLFESKWVGATWAVSEHKAICNILYQFKKMHGMPEDCMLSLDSKCLLRRP